MTTPPLGSGILLDQMLVGGAASLVNLIIHAVLLAAVVWTVHRLSVKDNFVPAFLQYSVAIVPTGTLLVAGHFAEVLGATRHRPRLFRLRQLHDARLRRHHTGRPVAAAEPHYGAERHHADRLVDGAHHRDSAALRNAARQELKCDSEPEASAQ